MTGVEQFALFTIGQLIEYLSEGEPILWTNANIDDWFEHFENDDESIYSKKSIDALWQAVIDKLEEGD